jgi:hypothetical protein
MPERATAHHKESGNGRLVAIVAALLLVPFCYSLITQDALNNAENAQPFLERPDPKYTKCVRETSYMRFHHWELLRATREEVVRYGIRSEISLKKCRECHTSRERFCNQCHNAASVTPDCFDCHYYP